MRFGWRAWAFRPRPQRVFTFRFFVLTGLLLVVSQVLSGLWIIEYPNLLSNETLLMFAGRPQAQYTALVVIDREGGDSSRSRRSMNVDALATAVCTVAAHNPSLLLVDFDTSDQSFAPLQALRASAPIVWARALYRFRGETIVENVLGQAGGSVEQGFAVGAEDLDGAVRRFVRTVDVDGRSFPTLHWRAVELFREHNSPRQHVRRPGGALEVAELASHFEFPSYRLADLNEAKAAYDFSQCEADSVGTIAPDFSGKVVLLGGTYDFADTHRTTVGELWGVELLASAIEAELSGHGVRGPVWWHKLALEILVSIAIALLYSRVFAIPATLVTLFGLLPVMMLGNVLAVWIAGYDAMIAPFVVGLVIEMLTTNVEQADEAQRIAEGLHVG